jgi:hypothetical protein
MAAIGLIDTCGDTLLLIQQGQQNIFMNFAYVARPQNLV